VLAVLVPASLPQRGPPWRCVDLDVDVVLAELVAEVGDVEVVGVEVVVLSAGPAPTAKLARPMSGRARGVGLRLGEARAGDSW
jgi:hypothetical protein